VPTMIKSKLLFVSALILGIMCSAEFYYIQLLRREMALRREVDMLLSESVKRENVKPIEAPYYTKESQKRPIEH
jgi:hypothetical protein